MRSTVSSTAIITDNQLTITDINGSSLNTKTYYPKLKHK